MSTCRSCQAEIRWATTRAGKAIPLDVPPTAEGNVVLEREGARDVAVTLGGFELELARSEGRETWMPHHATCPQAKDWRR